MKAYELLDSPEKWCQNDMAQDMDGKPANFERSSAYRFCALAAILLCYPMDVAVVDHPERRRFLESIGLSPGNVGAWNDAPERTWQEVYDALRKADV